MAGKTGIKVGKLFVCGTPIGNLEDVSIRLLKTLRQVDMIACEDTRHTLKLLNRFKIKNKLVSYHQYSDKSKEDYLLQELENGKLIALVSDAGMPSISDPGQELVQRAITAGVAIEIIPGPSAVTTALAISGLDSTNFIFAGFLPNRHNRRREVLQELSIEKRTVIYYEAPHRLFDTLVDIEEIMGGDRQIVVARELTKTYEEIIRDRVEIVRNHFSQHPPRGEICLLVAGKKEEIDLYPDLDRIIEEVNDLVELGHTKKEAFKMKALEYHISKSTIYNYYVEKFNNV
jgi:16S rRNA (cytidine1402-2'-O)-methyltransferase